MPKLALVGNPARDPSGDDATATPKSKPAGDDAWLANLEVSADVITQMLSSEGYRAVWLLGFLTGCAIGEGV
ncbi:MAG: hypothetical protein ACYDGR_07860 [Candidatus Dormibacteria bacterium]